MTQDRAYRIRFASCDAVAELLRCSPTQFDPRVVSALLAVLARH
jgi:HD-GYP domain-containing protein (c-di-GMP phosphodiesterase class II)